MKFLQKNNNGFTLAEVLITLVIIGVIASMTIPTLMNKTNHSELKTGFNKALSVSSQTIQKMKQEYGDIIYDPENETVDNFKNKFMKYFAVNCDNCADSTVYKNRASETVGIRNKGFVNNNRNFITQDGMAFFFMKGNPSYQMFITIDVNGPQKGPNRWGRDTFTFFIPIDNQIFMPCTDTEPYGSGCNNSSDTFNGMSCSSKAITEKDYFEKL